MAVADLNVLIVDDHPLARRIVAEVVRAMGVRSIREAEDGAQGWREIVDKVPDIAIVDLSMPIDGMQLLKRIRRGADSPDRELPVVILTGHSDKKRITRARDGGATEIVAKPVSIATLLEKIAAVVDRPRPFVNASCFVGPDRRRRKHGNYSGPRRRAGEPKAAGEDVWEV